MPTAANCESELIRSQQLWSECSRLLANCIIYYNACILSADHERRSFPES
jgi:Tn3 transposase DDE domain